MASKLYTAAQQPAAGHPLEDCASCPSTFVLIFRANHCNSAAKRKLLKCTASTLMPFLQSRSTPHPGHDSHADSVASYSCLPPLQKGLGATANMLLRSLSELLPVPTHLLPPSFTKGKKIKYNLSIFIVCFEVYSSQSLVYKHRTKML